MTPVFTSLVDALAYWRARDRAVLRAAIVPPVNALGDEVHDVALAVIFRDIAGEASRLAQVARIQGVIDANTPQLEHLRTIDPRYQPEAPAAAARIAAMIDVLQGWSSELLDAGAQSVGRAA